MLPARIVDDAAEVQTRLHQLFGVPRTNWCAWHTPCSWLETRRSVSIR